MKPYTMTDEERRAVEAENNKIIAHRRCPMCGYTKADQDIHHDHGLCERRGGIHFRALAAAHALGRGGGE